MHARWTSARWGSQRVRDVVAPQGASPPRTGERSSEAGIRRRVRVREPRCSRKRASSRWGRSSSRSIKRSMPDSWTSWGSAGVVLLLARSHPSDALRRAGNGAAGAVPCPRRCRDGTAGRLRADRGGAGGALHAGRALGEGPKALEYTTAAGRDAAAHLAFEDAAAYFEQALELLDQYAPADTAPRVELLISRAEALVCVDEKAGVHEALRAVEAARANGSAEQFGRAVAVFAQPVSAVMSYPDQVATLLDEAQRRARRRSSCASGSAHGARGVQVLRLPAPGPGRSGTRRSCSPAGRDAGDGQTLTAALFARAVQSGVHRGDDRAARAR